MGADHDLGWWLAAILAALSIAGILIAVIRRAARKVKPSVERMNRALDVVLGTPEESDPDRPGEVRRPAVPDIGVRMTRLEDAVSQGSSEAFAKRAQDAAATAEEAAHAAAQSAHAAEEATRTAQNAKTIAQRAADAAQKAEQHAADAAADAARALAAVQKITTHTA